MQPDHPPLLRCNIWNDWMIEFSSHIRNSCVFCWVWNSSSSILGSRQFKGTFQEFIVWWVSDDGHFADHLQTHQLYMDLGGFRRSDVVPWATYKYSTSRYEGCWREWGRGQFTNIDSVIENVELTWIKITFQVSYPVSLATYIHTYQWTKRSDPPSK